VEWLSVRDAAERLGVSETRVRQLAVAGELPARRHSAGWLVADEGVEARRQSNQSPGRPLKSENAWLLLSVLTDASRELIKASKASECEHLEHARALVAMRCDAVHGRWPEDRLTWRDWNCDSARPWSALQWQPFDEVNQAQERSLRRGLRHALRSAPDPGRWKHWLARRSDPERYWAHPGVINHLRSDSRLSLGGAWAAAKAGADIAPDDRLEFYVRGNDRDDVVRNYRLRRDPKGTITLRVIPRSVPDALAPSPPEAVAPVIAALDLVESSDMRSNKTGMALLEMLHELLNSCSEPGERERPCLETVDA
jgi:excisionase family DNA binding protein